MIFLTTYKIKPYISNEETKKLLQVFAENGPRTRYDGAFSGRRRQPRRGGR